MGVATLGFLHLLAQGEIRAIVLLNHVNGDVDGGLGGRIVGRNGQAHRDVKQVFALNWHTPYQTDVLLCGLAEVVVVG